MVGNGAIVEMLVLESHLHFNHVTFLLFCSVFDGRPRRKEAVTSAAGAVVGEPTNEGSFYLFYFR